VDDQGADFGCHSACCGLPVCSTFVGSRRGDQGADAVVGRVSLATVCTGVRPAWATSQHRQWVTNPQAGRAAQQMGAPMAARPLEEDTTPP
jgi:hypothetical protein